MEGATGIGGGDAFDTMSRNGSRYLPQLDSLRALAVVAVMIHHWTPGFLGFDGWGDLGVRCFFVLSGFLITGILLRARDAVEAGGSSVGWQMRQFYVRRSLRIFPIYYLTLLFGVWFGMNVLRETFWWHAGYGSNFYFALRGEWRGYISHLWSLSVEEQFYLVWPALVLLLPRRVLPIFFGGCVAAAVVSRGVLAMALGADHITLKVLLPCCLDSLVVGALLAWVREGSAERAGFMPREGWKKRAVGPVLAASFAVVCGLGTLDLGKPVLAVFGPLVESFFFARIIGRCASGFSGVTGRVLDLAPLQYLGRISYGLYLYHLFAGYMADRFAEKLGLTVPAPGLAQFGLFFGMTLVAAALSARWIEKPFNRLKRFFPAGSECLVAGPDRAAENQSAQPARGLVGVS